MTADTQSIGKESPRSSTSESDLEGGKVSCPEAPAYRERAESTSLWRKIASIGVEAHGIGPIPLEARTDTHFFNLFTLWFSMSLNLLPIVTGMAATLSFGMNLRDASLTILFFSILTILPPAYIATLGPKTGLRQMIQARYSFGYFGVWVPVLLNLATLVGFCVITAVVGGQGLAAVTGGKLSWNVGIIIIAIVGMVFSFAGYRVLHQYERYAWIPVLIAVVVATGCGGKNLQYQADVPSATAATVLSYGGLLAGFFMPWGAISSDFATYMSPKAPRWAIFTYTFWGLFLPSVPLLLLGAAIGGAVPNVPSWQAGYESGSAGGILAAMLEPAGGFGKFIVVLLAFSTVGNLAGTGYAISLNFQTIFPFLWRVPRPVYAIVNTAIVIPVSIQAAKSFFASLENFIGVIGYWSASFLAIVTLEHVYFRKADTSSYDPAIYDQPRELPLGVAAVMAGAMSFALVIPCMAQIWYTGPIAKKTGDIGFEVAFVLSGLLYLIFRTVELRFRPKLGGTLA